MIKDKLAQVVAEVVGLMGFSEVEVGLERPADEGHGAWSTNAALVLWGKMKGTRDTGQGTGGAGQGFSNPRELGEKLREEILKQVGDDEYLSGVIEKVEVAGPGFVNFRLSESYYLSELGKMLKDMGDLGTGDKLQVKSDKLEKKKVIVEYSSPNIAKPFTIGHLRSTIIGDAVANLLEAVGHEVIRDNHLGDWGTQFGKQIYAIKTWGDEEEIEKAEKPVKKLVELYVKFHEEAEKDPELNARGREWFKKLEDGDAEARRLWQKCVDWSWKEFDVIYKRLGVPTWGEFVNDGRGYGESYFEDKMDVVVEKLDARLLLKEGKEGAKIVEFPEEEKMPPALIIKSDGATLYHTRDLATDKFRKEKWNPDLVINEVGAEQELYFRQLYKMEEMLGWFEEGERVHIAHGLYRFAEGKMSTRKGNVIWLEEVLAEAVERARQMMEEAKKGSDLSEEEKQGLAEVVGIGALKWNDLKSDPRRQVLFDWDEILNMAGDSGPYVQYTYARARSVLRKAGEKKQVTTNKKQTKLKSQTSNMSVDETAIDSSTFAVVEEDEKLQVTSDKREAVWEAREFVKRVKDGEIEIELNEEERAVLRQLVRFGEVVERAAEELAPHLVAGYVYELAQRYNSFYNKHSILGNNEQRAMSNDQETGNNEQEDELRITNYELRDFRLALTAGVAEVLKIGLGLLGIEAPARM